MPQSKQQFKPVETIVDGVWVYTGISYCIGKLRGLRDSKTGKLCLQTFGNPARWRDSYAALLENHGIRLTPISDGPVNGKVREQIRGYNSVMKAHIKKRHGRDFLQMIVEQAREQAAKQHLPT